MSNNALHNKDCPPLMSDQRFATDYRPSCQLHDLINKQNNLLDSHQQRQFLQHNAVKLMNLNLQHFNQRANCGSCTMYHVDPNGHDRYWDSYKSRLES